MSSGVEIRFSGQDDYAMDRDGYLDKFNNETKQSVIIDLEMTTLPVLLGICFFIGIFGNGALFYTICKAKKFRNAPNQFLLNIAISNVFLLIICPPMLATSYVLGGKWPFGNVACKMVYSIPQSALAVSMFSLVGLSIERYGAFAAPPKHRDSVKNRACFGTLAIWILGGACGLPLSIFAYEKSTFRTDGADEEKRVVCTAFNEHVWEPLYPKIHTIVSISFLFIIPIILCTIFYLSLSCVVCGKKQRENRAAEDDSTPLKNGTRSSRSGTLTKTSSNTKTNTTRTIDSRTSVPTLKRVARKRRTMAKVALFLMMQFTILWTPQWAHTLRWYFSFEKDMVWYLMQLIGQVCIYLNAALTPFTVIVFNRTFRQQLGKYFCCCFSCLHCCACFEKREKHDSPLPSTSDVSVKKSKKSKCCICCCSREDAADSDIDSTASKDVPDGPAYQQNGQVNVYQELPTQGGYYDSCTLPISHNRYSHDVYASPNKSLAYHPADQHRNPYATSERPSHQYDPSDPQRSSYAVAINHERPVYSASYTAEDQIDPYRDPAGMYYSHGHPPYHRYISEPLLHAQAPKYSKIFMPQHNPRIEQATSIREVPAM